MRAQLADALASLDAELPVRVPVWIGDERRDGDELVSTDPSNPDRVVAVAASATPDEVDRALAAAAAAFPSWSRTPAEERARDPPARGRDPARAPAAARRR